MNARLAVVAVAVAATATVVAPLAPTAHADEDNVAAYLEEMDRAGFSNDHAGYVGVLQNGRMACLQMDGGIEPITIAGYISANADTDLVGVPSLMRAYEFVEIAARHLCPWNKT